MLPSDDLGQCFDVAIDDVIACGVSLGLLHDDEPVFEVAAVEQDGFFRGTVGPVRGGVVEGGGSGACGEGAEGGRVGEEGAVEGGVGGNGDAAEEGERGEGGRRGGGGERTGEEGG